MRPKFLAAYSVAAFLVCACLVVILPAAHQAFGAPTDSPFAVILPPLNLPQDSPGGEMRRWAAWESTAANNPSPFGLRLAIRDIWDLPSLAPASPPSDSSPMTGEQTEAGNDSADDFTVQIPGPNAATNQIGHILTDEEYQQFRKIIDNSGATVLQVGTMKATIQGITVLIVMLALIGGLMVLRRMFDRWFDAHIYDNTWASTAVVVALLLILGMVLTAAIKG